MSTWYLLFEGSSADGRGNPDYVGRTTDPAAAKKHFRMVDYRKDPYSTGKVMIVTDSTFYDADLDDMRWSNE